MCKSFPDFVSLLLDAAATVDKDEEHCYAAKSPIKRLKNGNRNYKKHDSIRKKHNDMEKTRRANHKNLFHALKSTLPPNLRSSRMSQIKTLNVAAQYIKDSQVLFKDLTMEYEIEQKKYFEYLNRLQILTRSQSRSSIESCADSGHFSCKSISPLICDENENRCGDDDDVKIDDDDDDDDDVDSIIIDVM